VLACLFVLLDIGIELCVKCDIEGMLIARGS